MCSQAAVRAATRLAFCLALASGGCGPRNEPLSEEDYRQTSLLDVGEMLRLHQLDKAQPPESFEDLRAAGTAEQMTPMGFEAVRSGDVVVRWGATLPSTEEAMGTTPDSEVLAYVKEAPERGGPVLLLNRSVTQMTAEEFRAAPKAGNDPAPQ